MSLYDAASYMASKGRGDDSVLVHMTPGEVGGLQSLALAHGGSLTINPETGLVEAGFLKKLLPMIAGAALTFFSGGTLTPLMAGMMVGGGTALATGDLGKGLSAGLGAWGGGGLGEGIATLGADSLANTAVPQVGLDAVGAASTAGNTIATDALKQATLEGFSLPTDYAQLAAQTATPEQLAAGDLANKTMYAEKIQAAKAAASPMDTFTAGIKQAGASPSQLVSQMGGGMKTAQMGLAAASPLLMQQENVAVPEGSPGLIRPYTYDRQQPAQTDVIGANYTPGQSTRERTWFNNTLTAGKPYAAPGKEYKGGDANPFEPITQTPIDPRTGRPYDTLMADGGEVYNPKQAAAEAARIKTRTKAGLQELLASAYDRDQAAMMALEGVGYKQGTNFAGGGSINLQGTFDMGGGQGGGQMGSSNNPQPFIGSNNAPSMMPQQGIPFLPDPTLDPKIRQVPTDIESVRQSMINTKGLPPNVLFAGGGISNLGGYSDGGRLLRGPGDGVSDSIPAMIGKNQPARLSDGEFVVPARAVSELGNGSTKAGAKKLYSMLDRIQGARAKTTGKNRIASNTNAQQLMPA